MKMAILLNVLLVVTASAQERELQPTLAQNSPARVAHKTVDTSKLNDVHAEAPAPPLKREFDCFEEIYEASAGIPHGQIRLMNEGKFEAYDGEDPDAFQGRINFARSVLVNSTSIIFAPKEGRRTFLFADATGFYKGLLPKPFRNEDKVGHYKFLLPNGEPVYFVTGVSDKMFCAGGFCRASKEEVESTGSEERFQVVEAEKEKAMVADLIRLIRGVNQGGFQGGIESSLVFDEQTGMRTPRSEKVLKRIKSVFEFCPDLDTPENREHIANAEAAKALR